MSNKIKKDVLLIDIDTFATRYNYKSKTVLNNIERIKGAFKKDEKYYIPDSARYPYNLRRTSIKTREEKMYVVLKATSENRYVDDKLVGLSKASFTTLIKELLYHGLLQENKSDDYNGANAYDTTIKADEALAYNKKRAIIEIGKALAEVAGIFTAQLLPK